MKTKAQELAILDNAIALLGPDSYLGPWLKSIRGEVERDVRSDLAPDYSLAAAKGEIDRIMVEANATAKAIKDEAKRNADVFREDIDKVRDTLRSDLYAALRNLDR